MFDSILARHAFERYQTHQSHGITGVRERCQLTVRLLVLHKTNPKTWTVVIVLPSNTKLPTMSKLGVA